MKPPFKVRVKQFQGTHDLPEGKTYTVAGESEMYYYLSGREYEGGWIKDRFEIVKKPKTPNKTMKLNLPKRTRFAPNNKSLSLRNGSLYRVNADGSEFIARLREKVRAKLDDTYYLMSVHGQPLLAREDEITRADKTEVDRYLAGK